MKKILSVSLLMLFQVVCAQTFSIVGKYENKNGCQALINNCSYFHGEDKKIQKNCTLEVYKNGEYLAGLGKNGVVKSSKLNLIKASDVGPRFGSYGIEYVNTQAEMKILKSIHDPSLYSDVYVTEFDLSIEDKVAKNGKHQCLGLKLVLDSNEL